MTISADEDILKAKITSFEMKAKEFLDLIILYL